MFSLKAAIQPYCKSIVRHWWSGSRALFEARSVACWHCVARCATDAARATLRNYVISIYQRLLHIVGGLAACLLLLPAIMGE